MLTIMCAVCCSCLYVLSENLTTIFSVKGFFPKGYDELHFHGYERALCSILGSHVAHWAESRRICMILTVTLNDSIRIRAM